MWPDQVCLWPHVGGCESEGTEFMHLPSRESEQFNTSIRPV